ncbi:LOW QUALITY PROTEIN: arf-GAP with SH3 domain, ANK repeat and PH domain-containing protein 2-like [Menidia menidia]
MGVQREERCIMGVQREERCIMGVQREERCIMGVQREERCIMGAHREPRCMMGAQVHDGSWCVSRQVRKDYILAKYTERRFARRRGDGGDGGRLQALYRAVRDRDVLALIQVHAEGADLMEAGPQPNQHEPGETALHLAVRMVDRDSLHIVDFLAQNSGDLDRQTARGSTALHYCCLTDNLECLKLLLRGRASTSIPNDSGETPLDIARRLKHAHCEELLTQAQTGKFNVHVHVEYEWRLQNEDLDESEDEMEDKPIPTRREERPVSCFLPGAAPPPAGLAALARDAALLAKQRPPPPSGAVSNETYGAVLNLPPPGPTPPLPPRGPHRGRAVAMETVGRQRSSSDPPALQSPAGNSSTYVLPAAAPPPPREEAGQEHAAAARPAAAAVQGSAPPPPPSPPPVPGHQTARPPGPPGPPGPSGPPGPRPPKPQTGLSKSPPPRPPSADKRGVKEKSPHGPAPPTPKPRSTFSRQRPQRVKAIYNCSADQPDELSFSEGEVLVVEGEEDSEWWIGHVEAEPSRRGAFPLAFVHFITE